jgi:hypothetical protein
MSKQKYDRLKMQGALGGGQYRVVSIKPKTAHTSGPWQHRQAYDNGEPASFEVDAGRSNICAVATGAGQPEREEANARLIAAAPDLLAALQQFGQATAPFIAGAIGSSNPNIMAAVGQANAAIAKATGK